MIHPLTEHGIALHQRVSELERLCARQQETIRRQAVLLKQDRSGQRAMDAEIRRLQERIQHLEERLQRNSSNSSLPPSTDGPGVDRPKRRGKRKRQRGGQKGHSGRSRPLVPSDEVDAVVPCKPETCCSCNHPLSGDDPNPWRHQVCEIPKPRVEVTEYQRHRLTCPRCGQVTIGALPDGVSHSSFGPRLHALTALLTGRFLLSKRDAVTLYDVVFGLGVSPSSIIAMERRMAAAVADPVQDAMEWVRSAPVVHPDETSWRQAKKRAWLWTAATDAVAIFNIHRSRSQEAAKELLGADFAGAICSDRFGAYNWIDRRGYCWAHLKRDFQAMADRFGSEWYGLRLVAGAKRVMAAWRMHRDGEIDRQTRDQRLSEERRRIHRLLVAAKERAPAPKTRRECAELLKTEARMWTFVDIDGMPPTNNLAERCLRRAVIWRKKCFGTDSEAGSRFVACILTVVTTLQMQQRGAFEFLVHAQEASFRGSQPPSLCPTT